MIKCFTDVALLLSLDLLDMNCLKCDTKLADDTQIFFYYNSEKDVHLTIKPEIEVLFDDQETIYTFLESERTTRLKCRRCDVNVGKVVPFGPSNRILKAFACDKVKLSLTSSTGEKWYNLFKTLPIEIRDTRNFYKDPSNIRKEERTRIKKKVIDAEIKFPSRGNKRDFEWFTVSLTKKPRDFQIQAFVEGLQKNIVVVLDTGAGKTLVASMILAKMCKLNPGRMGLMIVDRVPLVFQQGDAIEEDTNLKVVRLCGENKTENKINRINREYYDILVVTAGALYEMLEKQYVDVTLFCTVIFDECHHLSGNHCYVNLIKKFTYQKLSHQPRIIGLTASPFAADTMVQGEINSDKFLKHFPEAKIYAPTLKLSHQETKKRLISLSDDQKRYINIVVDEVNKYLNGIAKTYLLRNLELKKNLNNSRQIIGDLRSMQKHYPDNKKDFKSALLLMEALEFSIYFGIPSSCKFLKDEGAFEKILGDFDNVTEISERLQVLAEYLENVNEDSRILVFVNKRTIANFLTGWIKKRFASLNAQKVVGHGGYDGMMWMGKMQQQECVKDFRDGVSRLLVTTSVLEEGIDVAQCDLVVAFTGSQSLISFIQMRGRARKKGSVFIIFETEEEREVKENAENQELIMRKVLQKHQQCVFSELSKHIVEEIKSECESIENVEDSDIESELTLIKAGGKELAFKLFIDPCEPVNLQKMIDHIIINLKNIELFTLKRFEHVSQKGIFVNNDVFSPNAQMFVAYVSPITHSTGPSVLYRRFVSSFDYRITIADTVYHIWSSKEVKGSEALAETRKVVCKKISVGCFKDRSTVIVGKVFEKEGDVCFNPHNSIHIDINTEFNTKIEIKFLTISKFSFLSINKDEIVLYINLTKVPLFSVGAKRICQGDLPSSFAQYPLLMITFNLTDYDKLLDTFHNSCLFPIDLLQTRLLCKEFDSVETLPIKESIPWSLKCISDSREVCFPVETIHLILDEIEKKFASHGSSQNVRDLCSSILIKLSQTPYGYFTNLYEEFQKTFNVTIDTPLVKDLLVNKVIPNNVFQIKRITVTPTRVISLPEVLIASNRFLRGVKHRIEDILIVQFRDDDGTKIQSEALASRYEDILSTFTEIDDKKYRYILSTGSQMRDHKAYFIQSETWEEIDELRNIFIPNLNRFSSVAKYVARLGMYGSTVTYAIDLPMDSIIFVDDRKAENGDLTTDGAGLISLTKADELVNILNLDETPSAFQIRYSGFKGVVTCTHDDDPQLEGKSFLMRKSMRKFQNGDIKFCVGRYSKYQKVRLNREIINLLSSIENSNIKNTLFQYLDEDFEDLLNMFENGQKALENLQTYLKEDDIKLIYDSRISLTENSFWFEVLKGIYRLRSIETKDKMNILVKDGAFLMGVPDPYGVLKEGEIFVQVQEEKSSAPKIIQKPAFIYRNPCLHPGDYRLVRCVDNIRLQHLYNVVVLPAFDCKVSLAAQCSGGDLDGDFFSVIWDDCLVPCDNFESCHYTALTKGRKQEERNVQNPEEVAKFFTDFMMNDELGKIAHRHLALCDIQPMGARDPLALELAKCQAQAVDYPKTGIKPIIRAEAIDIVSKNGYPDFMEKKFEESYQSTKTLGELYRHCKEGTFAFEPDVKEHSNIRDDLGFIRQKDYEKYLDDAIIMHEFYKYHIEMIMVKYKLRSEVDVVLASATYGWEDELEENKEKTSEIIKKWYNNIKKTCRDLFECDVTSETDKLSKAYAWYYVVNNKKSMKDKTKYLGFPWVVGHYLCKIRQKKDIVTSSRMNYIIGKSSVVQFKKKCYKTLLTDTYEKFNYVERVERAINQFTKETFKVSKGFIVQPYGSASLYVSEPESDIDICALDTAELRESCVIPSKDFFQIGQHKQQVHFLDHVVTRAIESLASEKKNVFNVQTPFIKFKSSNEEEPFSCDVSMNSNGIKKTYYFHHLFKKDWVYFMVFWSLVKWARAAELIRPFADAEKGEIDTADFYALIVYILDFPKIPSVDITKPINIIRLSKLYTNIKSHKEKKSSPKFYKTGEMLLIFFREVSKKSEAITVEWSRNYGLEGVKDVKIKEKVIISIASLARKALHCLSNLRDFEGLLSYFMTSEDGADFKKNLTTDLSFAIGNAKEFHSTLLQYNTGAKVRIDSLAGKKNLCIVAKGTRFQLDKLKKEIRLLRVSNKPLVLGRLPYNSSRYFMEGSSKLFSLQDTELDSRVNFEESYGACEAIHKCRKRMSLVLKDVDADCRDEQERKQYEKFKAHIMEQMSSFPAKKDELLNSLEVTTRFGCLYFIEVSATLPSASKTVSFQELQIALEKGRRTRKIWEKRDFVAKSKHAADSPRKNREQRTVG